MDTYIKRIQSRLSHAGFKVPKAECREAYQRYLPEEKWDNPSNSEISEIVDWVLRGIEAQSPSLEENAIALSDLELEVSENLVEAIPQSETFEITAQSNPDVWAMSQPPTTEENAIALSDLETEKAPLAKSESISPIISQGEFTQAISTVIRQLGIDNSAETNQMLSTLANELCADITDTEEMVTALVTAYLNKRQSVLSSAMGALNSIRSTQTESFQSGLDNDFFDQKRRTKESFLTSVNAMFN